MKVIIYADGGSRGNPGIAGSGTVIYAADGTTVLDEIVYVVGKKTSNNVAEYHGLLRGINRAAELGATDVEMYMDSKLVVEQIGGRWKIKHPDLKTLALDAKKTINSFDSFSLSWVPRAKNAVADKLSNAAMDACAAGHQVGVVHAERKPVADSPESSEHRGPSPKPGDWLGNRGEVTRFVLLRHGQTQMSVDKQYSGRTDVELNKRGKKEALAAGQALAHRDIAFDAIVCSPLKRCVQTAQAAAKALEIADVEQVDGLIEIDFGEWEGKSFSEVGQTDGIRLEQWMDDTSMACPNGESLQQLHKRVRYARKDLQSRYVGKTVLVVSHVNPIKSFIRQALDGNASVFEKVFLSPASISDVEFWSDGSLVRCINDIGHLSAVE